MSLQRSLLSSICNNFKYFFLHKYQLNLFPDLGFSVKVTDLNGHVLLYPGYIKEERFLYFSRFQPKELLCQGPG